MDFNHRYDIRFRVDGPSIHDTRSFVSHSKLMLRAFVADRFELKIHSEVRPASRLVLRVAKDGPKLQKSAEWNWPDWLTAPKDVGPYDFACASRDVGDERYLGIRATGMPISRLVSCLSNQLHTPVINDTGLTGSYNFRVLGLLSTSASPQSRFPTIFTVLQDQLGLILDSKELPTEIIVVDHAVLP